MENVRLAAALAPRRRLGACPVPEAQASGKAPPLCMRKPVLPQSLEKDDGAAVADIDGVLEAAGGQADEGIATRQSRLFYPKCFIPKN